MPNPSPLLSPPEAAERLGVSQRTLRDLRRLGLRYVRKTERLIAYRPEDIAAYIESRLTMDQPEPRAKGRRTLGRRGNVVAFETMARNRGW